MNRIKELRSKKKISTQELANATGIARSTLGSYETRGINPNAEKAQILADFFDVDVKYLLGTQEAKRLMPYEREISQSAMNELGNKLRASALLKNIIDHEKTLLSAKNTIDKALEENKKLKQAISEFFNTTIGDEGKFRFEMENISEKDQEDLKDIFSSNK